MVKTVEHVQRALVNSSRMFVCKNEVQGRVGGGVQVMLPIGVWRRSFGRCDHPRMDLTGHPTSSVIDFTNCSETNPLLPPSFNVPFSESVPSLSSGVFEHHVVAQRGGDPAGWVPPHPEL